MADLLITENSSWSGGFDSADNLAAILDSDYFGYVGNKIVLNNIKFDNSKANLKIYTDSAEFTGGVDVFI